MSAVRAAHSFCVLSSAVALGACIGSTAPGAAPHSVPAGQGVIMGGIISCSGLPPPSNGIHYAAGMVTVFEGLLNPGQVVGAAVAAETVQVDSTYYFVLPPGNYTLQATFPPPVDVMPFVQVTLKSGADMHVDIPNRCI